MLGSVEEQYGCRPRERYHIYPGGGGACVPTQAPCPSGQIEVFSPPSDQYVCVSTSSEEQSESNVLLAAAAVGLAAVILWRMRG